MKKKTVIVSVVILVSLFVLYPFMGKILGKSEKQYNAEKNTKLQGRISEIVVDSINKSTSFLMFKGNPIRYIPAFTYGLWFEVNVGDSLIKERGKFDYVIFRAPPSTKIDTLTYIIDTSTWEYHSVKSYTSPYFD